MARFLMRATGLMVALLLASCGGSSSTTASTSSPPPGGGAAAGGGPAQPTTLALSVSALSLSINDPALNAALTGTPRVITVTNTGLHDAEALAVSMLPALPAGALVTSNCGLVLSAGGSCQITITPGPTPSAAPLTLAPTDPVLHVEGTNTNEVTAAVRILGYANVHQGGYVYALDDTTPSTGSVGGKVLSLSVASVGEIWGPNGALVGVDFSDSPAAAQAIVAQFPAQATAAKTCADSTMDGYTDWYLPGLCDVATCVSRAPPMRLTLNAAYFSTAAPGSFWLSEAKDLLGGPSFSLATSFVHVPLNFSIGFSQRSDVLPTRCVRDFAG